MSDQFAYDPVVATSKTNTEQATPQFEYEKIETPSPVTGTPSDVSSFMADPIDSKQKASISVISKQAGVPEYTTEAITKTGRVNDWKGGIDWTAKQREIDALSFKQALGDKTPELEARIKELQAAQKTDPKANLIQNLVSSAGEQGAAGLRSGGMWLLGALSWPYRKLAEATGLHSVQDKQNEILSTIGENFGLSQERQAAIISNPLTGLGESAKESTAGITGPTYRQLVDQGVDKDVAAGASFVLGGALTALQALPAGRLVPGAQRLGEESFKAAVISLAQNGSLAALAKLWGTRVAVIGAEQSALGMMSATTQVLGEEWARQYSNRVKESSPEYINAMRMLDELLFRRDKGYDTSPEIEKEIQRLTELTSTIPATPFGDLTKDILVIAGTQAAIGTAIGGLTALKEIKPTYEMGAKLRSWVDDIRAARATNVTQGAEPKPVVKALPLPKAPMEEVQAILEAPQEHTQNIPEVQAKLDEVVKAITDNPTPETIPQAIEAAKASDAIAIVPQETLPATGVSDFQISRMVNAAKEKSGQISLPGTAKTWNDTVQVFEGQAQLWYNDPTGSTRMITEPVEPVNLEQAVKSGIPTPDASLQAHITQPWARVEMDARAEARDSAIVMQESGRAVDAQEYANEMKANELPGQEKPVAWYESQWDNMDIQRAKMDTERNDEFLQSLTKEDLQSTLRDIANNPEVVSNKVLDPWVAKGELKESDFQAFVAEAAKNPGKFRKAIEAGLDPEARQAQQDRFAESVASKVTKSLAADELLKKYSNVRIGELTTAIEPEQIKAARQVTKLLRAATKEPSSAIAYDSRVKIQDLQDSVALDSGPKVRQTRDKLKAYYAAHPEMPPDAQTQAILNQRLVSDMTVKELQDLAEQIDVERFKGKAIQDIKRLKEQKFIDDFKNRLMNDIQMGRGWKNNLEEPVIPPKGMEVFQKTKGKGSRQSEKERKGNIWQRQAANTLSPQRIFRFLGPAGERAWDMENAARTAEWRANDAILEPAVKKSKELGITPHTLARKLTTKDGLEFTVDDVLAMRWAEGDSNSRETLLYGNNITQEQLDDLKGQLREPEKLWGDYMQGVFGPDNYNRLTKAYVEEMNRQPPPKVDKYFPIRIQDKVYDSPGSEISEDLGSKAGVRSARPNKKFMISRRVIKPENRQAMRLGATSLFFEQIAKQEHYINTWETAKRLKKIFLTDPKVREQIAQMFGEDWNQAIATAINAFANPNALRATMPGDRFANAMRHALTSSGLMGNLVTVGYNLTGPLMYLGDAGPRYLFSGLAQWIVNPKRVYDEVTKNVPLIKHASIDPVIQGLKNYNPSAYRGLMQTVEKIGYQPLEWIDMWTRIFPAKGIHDKGIDDGLSEKDAWNNALLATQRGQPSGDPADLPMIYQAASLKIFLAFTRQLNQIWNMYSADIPQEIKQGKFLQAVGDMVAISVSGLLIAMMGQKDIPKDPGEAALWMLDQFVVAIPLVGNQLEPLLIGRGYHTGAEIIPGAGKMIADVKALTTGRKPVSARIDAAIRVAIDSTRFIGGPAVFLTRGYGLIHSGDPWELIGGKPRKR